MVVRATVNWFEHTENSDGGGHTGMCCSLKSTPSLHDCSIWTGFQIFPEQKKLLLTSVTQKHAADPSEQIQRDEVPQAGSDGRGYIIRVDSHLPGSNNHPHHHQTCRRESDNTQRITAASSLQWPLRSDLASVQQRRPW